MHAASSAPASRATLRAPRTHACRVDHTGSPRRARPRTACRGPTGRASGRPTGRPVPTRGPPCPHHAPAAVTTAAGPHLGSGRSRSVGRSCQSATNRHRQTSGGRRRDQHRDQAIAGGTDSIRATGHWRGSSWRSGSSPRCSRSCSASCGWQTRRGRPRTSARRTACWRFAGRWPPPRRRCVTSGIGPRCSWPSGVSATGARCRRSSPGRTAPSSEVRTATAAADGLDGADPLRARAGRGRFRPAVGAARGRHRLRAAHDRGGGPALQRRGGADGRPGPRAAAPGPHPRDRRPGRRTHGRHVRVGGAGSAAHRPRRGAAYRHGHAGRPGRDQQDGRRLRVRLHRVPGRAAPGRSSRSNFITSGANAEREAAKSAILAAPDPGPDLGDGRGVGRRHHADGRAGRRRDGSGDHRPRRRRSGGRRPVEQPRRRQLGDPDARPPARGHDHPCWWPAR